MARPVPARRLLVLSLALAGFPFLAAPAPAQQRARWCPEPEAEQFDFWLGEWDVRNHNRPPGGDEWAATGRATNRVYTVLGGCAVVEHWRGYAFPGAGLIVGFSVRAWNPETRLWEAVLLWPVSGPASFATPSGRAEEGEVALHNEFETPDGVTVRTRLRFHDIQDDALVWSNGVSRDGGRSWSSTWRMDFTRRPPTASGLWNGPSMTTDRCPGARHRAFDRHLGEWTGHRSDAEGDSTAVRTWLVRILEGCAVMERTWSEDGTRETFAVRAFDEDLGRWVEYAIASDRRALRRRESGPGGGLPTLTDVDAAEGAYTRSRWSADGGDLVRVEERAERPGGPWRPVAETRFTRRVGELDAPGG